MRYREIIIFLKTMNDAAPDRAPPRRFNDCSLLDAGKCVAQNPMRRFAHGGISIHEWILKVSKKENYFLAIVTYPE